MPQVSAADLAALRDQEGQFSRFYLGVLVPATVHTSQINHANIPRGRRTIAFDTGAYSAGFATVTEGMTLWVGTTADSHDICKLRIRTYTTGDGGVTGSFLVCEHNFLLEDNYHLTVKEEFKLWPRHARAEQAGLWPVRYNDYDIAYSGQNKDVQRDPIVRMGPPAVAIRDGATGLATVRFWSDSGAAPGGNAPGSYAWAWRGGTPATAATAGTEGTPHVVTWDDTGSYLATLTLDGTISGYRPVLIYNATGTSTPYEDFEVQSLSGDFDTGGWRMSVRVKEDCAEADFPSESMVVVWAEDWYKGDQVSIGGNYRYREDLIFCGYITKDTVRKDPETNDVLFEAHTIDGEMKNNEQFPLSVEDDPNADNNWGQIQNMTMDKVAYFITKWQSTLLDITDVHFSSVTRMVRWFDCAQKSLYEQLDQDCYNSAIFCRALSDRMGIMRFERDPQFRTSQANRDAIPTVMDIETQDWRDQITFPSPQVPRISVVDLSAGSYAGSLADVQLIFSLAHGDVPMERGRTVMVDNLIAANQNQANRMAGNYLAWMNNPYPRVRVPITNNYRVFDITPQEWVEVTLAAEDTYRGVVWDDERFLAREVRFSLNNTLGAVGVDLGLELESSGTAGVAGYYPDEPPDEPYDPPETPDPPPYSPTVDDWEGIWVVGCWGDTAGSQPGILRTENLGGVTAFSPTWSAWTTGIAMGTYPYCRGLGRDPWHPKTRLYTLFSRENPGTRNDCGHIIYRREYSSGAWGSWTVILDETIINSIVGGAGGAVVANSAWISRFSTNINADGHLYCMVTAHRGAPFNDYPQWFFKSTDYGDNWAAGAGMAVQPYTSPQVIPIAVRAGMLVGTSGFAAGQVIYASWRNRSAGHYCAISVSTNQGGAWALVDGGTNVNEKGKRLMVDPNDQSILYAIEDHAFGTAGHLWKYTNDGAVIAGEQAAWGNVSRAAVCRVGEAATMNAAATSVLKHSFNGGVIVSNVPVDGNIAGGGGPLNWNWNRLMAIHSYVNGAAGTRYFQISPDGGTTWYNKHGNMAGDFNGLVNTGFSLDN